ncbi:hypothetical protein VNO77_20723 [Canavalia gladiata]|uniref:Uncharacterized protein n=1 Tax=Canavalia gladiata TaxID=3824 RepID=A0AAN9LQN2_CANGL
MKSILKEFNVRNRCICQCRSENYGHKQINTIPKPRHSIADLKALLKAFFLYFFVTVLQNMMWQEPVTLHLIHYVIELDCFDEALYHLVCGSILKFWCLVVKSSLSEVNGVVAPLEPALLILDEIGCLIHCQYPFCAYVPEAAGNLRNFVMSKHHVCEDG